MQQAHLDYPDVSKVKIPKVTTDVLIRNGMIIVTNGAEEISLTTSQASALHKKLGLKVAASKRIYRRGRKRRVSTAGAR